MLVHRTRTQVDYDFSRITKKLNFNHDQAYQIRFALHLGLPLPLIRKAIANPKLSPGEMKTEALKQYHQIQAQDSKEFSQKERKERL